MALDKYMGLRTLTCSCICQWLWINAWDSGHIHTDCGRFQESGPHRETRNTCDCSFWLPCSLCYSKSVNFVTSEYLYKKTCSIANILNSNYRKNKHIIIVHIKLFFNEYEKIS